MTARRVSKVKAAKWRAELDLFGEVPVTRQDVYAWLLAVVNLEPTSARAFSYVRSYNVLNKIVRAKLDGTFDDLIAPAKHSARFREIAGSVAVDSATNELGLGDWGKRSRVSLASNNLRAPYRPKEVIEEQRARDQVRKLARKAIDAGMLRRLPKSIPALSLMLADIGNPAVEALAESFEVKVATVRRWLRDDSAPVAVLLALFWLTRWGASEVDANAHNDAVAAVSLARSLQSELDLLRTRLQKVGRIADFGSANDPIQTASAGIATTDPYPVPHGLPSRHEVPIVFTSLRSAPCADSGRRKKSA